MLRVALIGVAGILLALQLKALKPEYAVYLCLAVSLLIFSGTAGLLGEIAGAIRSFQDYLPVNAGYLTLLLKLVGITYLAEFASDLCRDAGYQTVAGQIQIFGKLSVLSMSIPVVNALLGTLQGFLGG